MRFLGRCVVHEARKLLVVGVLFVLLLPVFFAWFEPVAHLRYHLGSPELVELDATLDGAAEHRWVQVEGRPDPEAFAVRTWWAGEPKGYLFRLWGYPGNLLVWAPEGALYDTLAAALPDEPGSLEPDAAALAEAQDRAWTFRGRLYAGHDDWAEPFSEYLDADEVEADDFVRDLGDTLPDGPFRRGGGQWWLLVVGEDPAPERLADGPLPVFGIGVGLGLVGFGWIAWRGWAVVREGDAPDRHVELMERLDEWLLAIAARDPRVDEDVVERVRHELGELEAHELELFAGDEELFRGLVDDRLGPGDPP